MLKYILKRIFSAILTIWVIMTVTFFLMKVIPGDPFSAEKMPKAEVRAAMNEKYGFDKPLHIQYVKYITDFMKGDFGVSYHQVGLTVNQIIADGFPYSLRVGLISSLFVVTFGVLMGVLSALRHNSITDHILMILSTLGSTIPSFVLATGFLFLFSKKLGWVPAFGVSSWKSYIGPVLIVGIFSLAYITRLTRTSILEELQQDYVRTARAKGLSECVVIGKHTLRNAMIPVVTYIAPMIAGIVTGSFVIEKVFGIPGIGNLFTTSIINRDYSVIMGMTVFYSILLVTSILVVDIVYVIIDPRIQFD